MFWSSDDALFGVKDMVENTPKFLEAASKRNVPLEDMELLNEAVRHVKLAHEDPLWKAIQEHEDVPYRISGLKPSLLSSWTRILQHESGHDGSLGSFVHSDRLLAMQKSVIQRPRITEEDFIKNGTDVAERDALLRRLFIESQKGRDRNSTQKVRPHQEDINAVLKVEDAAKKARDPGILKEMKKDLGIAMNRLADDDDNPSSHPAIWTQSLRYHGGSILSGSLLGSVRVCSTASSKLNYIINEVLLSMLEATSGADSSFSGVTIRS
ncbi:hypothetical protein H0H87_003183 [Tephrocybe sp. NHM501043]|nr:hypothetical protein H0H87_003183 [Tephrocybe sp. NHM501043]